MEVAEETVVKIPCATIGHMEQQIAVNIKFRDVTYSVPGAAGQGKKDILKSVNGEFRSGELTAIMGSSGAGKSSLMNVLAGFKTKVKGNILVNDVQRDLNKFRKMSCYIMQMDELSPYLSVLETMQLAANLKIGDRKTSSEKKALIAELLENLGLSDVKHTRASNLSGGQRKRLAIALELVNNPPVMFFDEPTSGLDSASCVQCVSLLKKLARGGRTVICVIHQPSSFVFEMFDQLYLMAEGQCIYQGSIKSLVPFLFSSIAFVCPSDHNPADFAIEVAAGKYGYVVDKLVEATKQSIADGDNATIVPMRSTHDSESRTPDEGGDTSAVVLMTGEEQSNAVAFNAYGASFWKQFCLLYKRSLQCTVRDMTLTHLRITVHVLVGILVGLLYFGIGNEASKVFSNTALLLFNFLVLIFTAKMAAILTFPQELPTIRREYLNNWYSIKAYFLAKTAADLPFEVIFPSIYVVIMYFMTDQPCEFFRFFMFWTIMVMTSLVAQSIGLGIGIAFKIEVGVFMGPVSMAFPLLLCGYLVSISTVPIFLRWSCYLVYLKYAFQAAMMSLYGFDREKLKCSEPYCIFRSPAVIVEDFDVKHSIFWLDILVLAIFCLSARLFAFFFLRRKISANY